MLGLIVQHHKPECPMEKCDYSVQGQGDSEGLMCQWMFCPDIFSMCPIMSAQYLLNHSTIFLNQTCYGGVLWWGNHAEKLVHNLQCQGHMGLSSRTRSQRWLIWSKYDSFCYIFWTIDSLAANLGLMTRHHMPECLVKKLDYCIQGQCHSKGSKC